MSVTEYIAHYITARDLGLTIRDMLIDNNVGAYDLEGVFIANSAEQAASVDYNDPCNLVVEVPSGAMFTIRIEQAKTATRAKLQKELSIQPTQPEYGPRNV